MLHIVNLIIRAVTLLSKFMLVFLLARFLSPAELGFYGLAVVTVAYGIYPLGFEFYTFNVREMLADLRGVGRLIKSQMCLHLVLYIVFLPLFFLLFDLGLLPSEYSLYFFALLVVEHMNQEVFRFLIGMSRQIEANICLFIRQGAWVIVVAILFYYDEAYRVLDTIFISWLVSAGGALLLGAVVINKMKLLGWRQKVDILWIWRGMLVAFPLLIASMALNAISVIERYWFGLLQGNDMLGVYTFYVSISAALLSFMDAGVFSFYYPKLINAAREMKGPLLDALIKKMLINCFVLIVVFLLISTLFLDGLLYLIDRSIYSEYENLFYIALFAIVFHGVSCIYHYGLYAFKRDVCIMRIHVSAIVVFCVFVTLLSRWSFLYAVPMSVLIAYIYILYSKYHAYKSARMMI
jgi:O-antigen/teichoic acid export membrane protein